MPKVITARRAIRREPSSGTSLLTTVPTVWKIRVRTGRAMTMETACEREGSTEVYIEWKTSRGMLT